MQFTLTRLRVCADEGAASDHGAEQAISALSAQARVGLGDGLARDLQLLGQEARGRQLRADGQVSMLNGLVQLLVELIGQAFAADQVNVQFHVVFRNDVTCPGRSFSAGWCEREPSMARFTPSVHLFA